MELKHVLVTLDYTPENLNRIAQALAPAQVTFCRLSDRQAVSEALKTADAAILNSDLNDQILTEGVHLRWIHCGHAGLTKSARPEVFARGIRLTGSAGRSAPALAEHAMMLMMALSYNWNGYLANQRSKIWAAPQHAGVSLYGKTAAILGVGYTGSALARRLKAMDMTVLGYRRSCRQDPNVDEMICAENGGNVEQLLPRADFVILAINLSDETYHLLDEKRLAMMKPGAFLINMARGALIDEPALIRALETGKIAGAGLDTVTQEPLDPTSPLWTMPNVLITPHTSPAFALKQDNSVAVILKNIQALQCDAPLVNEFTARDVYTHPI